MSCCTQMIIPPNEDYTEVFVLISGDLDTGSEMDLTPYTAAMSFSLTADIDSTPLFTLTEGDGIEINGEAVTYNDVTYTTGVVRITVSAARAAMLEGKKGYCDLLIKGSSTSQVLFRTWMCSKGVTNPSVMV